MEKSEMDGFARMVELLDLRVRFDDLVINGGLILPSHARGMLTFEKADWILDFAHIKNKSVAKLPELLEVAEEYQTLVALEPKEVRSFL